MKAVTVGLELVAATLLMAAASLAQPEPDVKGRPSRS